MSLLCSALSSFFRDNKNSCRVYTLFRYWNVIDARIKKFFTKMNSFNILKLERLIVFFLMSLSVLLAADEEFDDDSIPESSDLKANFYNLEAERKFKELYPNLDELEPWSLAENLTEDFLKHICINILLDTYPEYVPTIRFIREYVAPTADELQTNRIIRHAPVLFKEGIKNMTLLCCVFKDFQFFVARGDDKHVFKMEKDDKSDAYFFFSGLHAIDFKDIL